MRIIHISGGGERGGARPHIFSLCRHLSKEHRVTLVSLRQGDFSEEATQESIDTHVLGGSVIASFFKLARYISLEKPDIVHCHGAKANLAGIFAKLFTPSTVFTTTVHSDYRLDYMHSFWRKQVFGRLNSIALRFFNYHICVSDRFKSLLISRGFKADKIMPIYNGVDFNQKCPEFDRGEYLKSVGIDYTGDEIVLGTAARLTPVKDIPTMLYAFARAYSTNPKLRLVIGGDGEIRDSLVQLASELGIGRVVSFCGWVKDIQQFFAACDINVLSSISETFPYTILEGVREGCATIASDVGGVTKMIENGESGYIFSSGDVDTFADYISTLASDSELRQRFAQNLLKTASSLYSVERMGERQTEIYENMLNLHSRPRRDGVLVCGAYGRGNSGDEAILKAIIDTCRSIDPIIPITVMTRRPQEVELQHWVRGVYTFNPFTYMPAMLRSRLFISGGGSLIQNVTSTRSLLFYLLTLFNAKTLGCRVLMYGCGIGAVNGSFCRWLTKVVVNSCAHIITVRDTASLNELVYMGITKPEVKLSADPAFSLSHACIDRVKEYFEQNGLDISGKYICFSLRRWKSFDNFKAFTHCATYAYKKYGLIPLFLPIEVPKDIAPSYLAAEGLLETPYKILTPPGDVPLVMGILGRMQMVCSMRLHTLVFATAAGVPCIASSYDIKVSSFMERIGRPDLCHELEDLSASWLDQRVDMAMDPDCIALFKEIPIKLREAESINREMAEKLLSPKGKDTPV